MNHARYIGDISLNDGDVRPFQVAALDNVAPEAIQQLESADGIQLVDSLAAAQGALIRSKTKLNTEADFHPQLSQVIRVGVGIDNIDRDLAHEAGVATLNTPGASTDAVARRVQTFVLAWAADLVRQTQQLQTGNWQKANRPSLEDMKLGLVGFGRIGQRTAERVGAEFAEILVHDPYLKSDLSTLGLQAEVRQRLRRTDTIEELLESADVVSLHAGGAQEILTPALLTRMKADSLLVNTARGGLVNPDALLGKMDDGMSAALDVYPTEGQPFYTDAATAALVGHDNFLGTPHTAASDQATQRKLGLEGAERMIQFAQQGTINPDNLPGLTLPRVDAGPKRRPGVRALLTHKSKKGTLEHISAAINHAGINVNAMVNSDQDENGRAGTEEALAATIADLDTSDLHTTRGILLDIGSRVQVLRSRLLVYAE